MSDLLLRGRVDMSEAKTALSDAAKSVKKYESEIESAAAATGRFQKTIGAQMKEVRRLLTYLEANGKANTQAYKDAQIELAKLTDQMGDMSTAARMMASDTVNLDIAKNSLNGLITAMGALQSVTALTGTESETFNRVMKGLQTTFGLVTAAIVLMNLAQKEFIATMKANPYGIAIAAAAALIGVLLSLSSASNEAKREQVELNKEMNKFTAEANKEIIQANALMNIAKDVTRSYAQRKNAVDELNKLYPELNANLKNEESQLSYNIGKWNSLTEAIKMNAVVKQKQAQLDKLIEKQSNLRSEAAEKWRERGGVEESIQLEIKANRLDDEINKLAQEIADLSTKFKTNTNTSTTPTTSAKKEYTFGSDEWLQHQDEDTVRRYWDWVYNGIMNEARNKPIKVKPIIIPEEQEEPEDPEFLKMLENYRFEQRKRQIDAENALNESSLRDQMDYYQRLYENEALSYEERAKAYEEYLERKRELADQEAQIDQQTMQSAANMINSLGSMISSIGGTLDDAGAMQARAIATVAQAIATIIQGYATATAQAAEAGPIAWAAFSVAGLAQVISVITTLQNLTSGRFANGGIVGGTTTVGDYNLARVNKGEMILNGTQQARLFRMLNGGNPNDSQKDATVTFRISGSDLVGTLNNYNKTHNRVR